MDEQLKTLDVHNIESLNSIEEKLEMVLAGKDCKLRLPATLNTRGALGIEVALLQLISTWLLAQKNKSIFHSFQTASTKGFEDLCNSIYGISALALVGEIWDAQKNPIPRSLVLSSAKSTVEALRKKNFSKAFNSHYFGIPCIKRPAYDFEFEMPVYNNGNVIDSGAFLQTLREVFENIIGGRGRYERLDDRINVEELSEVLWELFKNTHDHGRHDIKGNELSLNFRGLIVQQQDLTKKYLAQWCGDNPTIAQREFTNNLVTNSDKFHILDISIFDMGKGFVELARKSAGTDVSPEILLWCLKEGNSRLDGSSRGSGLTKVLGRVSKNKGWIRIRTGKLLLEKSYSMGGDNEISLEDISVVSRSVVGTSIHISIPLNSDLSAPRRG